MRVSLDLQHLKWFVNVLPKLILASVPTYYVIFRAGAERGMVSEVSSNGGGERRIETNLPLLIE